ncbi:MAG: TrkH family potassium uptake protein [Pirellulales bacterium]
MNTRLVARHIGTVSILIGVAMLFSLPWAFPALGRRTGHPGPYFFEWRGFTALAISFVICLACGLLLRLYGRSGGHLYRKEAMAIVGLSWVMATVLGALPYFLADTYRASTVRLMGPDHPPLVEDVTGYGFLFRQHWVPMDRLDPDQYDLLLALADQQAIGLDEQALIAQTENHLAPQLLRDLAAQNEHWESAILFPNDARDPDAPENRENNYRIRWSEMDVIDCLFESQSGFSTTGATVIDDLEDPHLVAHCILFWRNSTQFLGGLGIIVLFVVLLGQGSAGKALMRTEIPGPTKEGATARMQHTAWLFAGTYCGLNVLLTLILMLFGLTLFDALCHALSTLATGGFSTWNNSVGHFDNAALEYVIILFMLLGGSNFTLLYYTLVGQPRRLLGSIEWRVYISVILLLSTAVIAFGLAYGDWPGLTFLQRLSNGIRYGLFQVVAIITTTGFGTDNFDGWNSFGRGTLFLLMFVGGCAGSTSGGLKVIRHILFLKIMKLEIEKSFHPTVVRPIRLGGEAIEDADLRKNILVYFSLILVIFVFSWAFVVTVEPDSTWGFDTQHKLIDSASGVAATLNNIGPGLGTVGAKENYTNFSPLTKLLFIWLMMLGRVEIFVIVVLFMPSFWRSR